MIKRLLSRGLEGIRLREVALKGQGGPVQSCALLPNLAW